MFIVAYLLEEYREIYEEETFSNQSKGEIKEVIVQRVGGKAAFEEALAEGRIARTVADTLLLPYTHCDRRAPFPPRKCILSVHRYTVLFGPR